MGVPLLHEMNAHGRRVAVAYYEAGVLDGIEIGRRQVEAEDARAWAYVREVWGTPSKGVPYADLCEVRGEPEKAEAHRRLLRERGVV